MARTRKYFEHRLDEALAGDRRLILNALEEKKIPDFECRLMLFQYILRLEAIVAENCAGPGVVSNDGLNEWTKAKEESSTYFF
jgi:hypothetical protein